MVTGIIEYWFGFICDYNDAETSDYLASVTVEHDTIVQ